jgi:tape measure domain-containing protein
MASKKLDAYKLAVSLDASGGKGIDQLKEADKQAQKTSSSLQKLKKDFKDALDGDKDAGKSFGRNLGKNISADVGDMVAHIGSNIGSLVGTAVAPGIGTMVGSTIGSAVDAAMSKLSGPVLKLIGQGLDLNEVLEGAETHFSAVLGSLEAARGHLEYLDNLEPAVGIDMRELISASQRLEEFNEDISLTEVELKAAGVQAKVFGSGVAGFHTIADALGLIAQRGELSSRSLLKLNKQGIPAMKYLAEATGLSEKKLKQWADRGELDGVVAARLISEGIIRNKGAQAESVMQNTVAGQRFRFHDNMEDLAATGTHSLYLGEGDLYRGANAILESPQAEQLVEFLDKTAGSLIKMTEAAVKTGYDVTSGLITGMLDTANLTSGVTNFVGEFTKALRSSAGFDSHSPSEKMKPVGADAGAGVIVGFEDYMQGEGLQRLTTAVRETVGQARNRARVEQIAEQEPGFIDALKRGSAQRGINPDDFLNLMAVESGFRKSVINKWGYLGLGQVGRAERGDLGLPVGDREAQQLFASRSYTWQLENVLFPFFDMKNKANRRAGRGNLDTLAEMYAAWGSGHSEGDPFAIHATRGGKRAGMYANNPAWDPNRDGKIQEYEFAVAARAALGAGVNFTVGGAGVSATNPLPVTLVRAAGVGDLKGGTGYLLDAAEAQTEVFATALGNATEEVKTEFVAPVKDLVQTILPERRHHDFGKLAMGADRSKIRMREAAGHHLSQGEQEANAISLHKGGYNAPGFFSGRSYAPTDEAGEMIRNANAAQYAGTALKDTFKDVKNMGKEAFGELAQGVGSMVSDYVLLGEVGPDALKKVTAQVLASAAQEAAVKGIMALADGFIHLFTNPAQSAADFTAAGLYFAVAGVAAGVGRAVAGDLFKDKGTAPSQDQQNQAYAEPSNPANNYTRRAYGGPVYRGRSYIVGDGGRAEVFEPNQDGRIHPSVDAYVRAQAIRGRQRQLEGGGLHGMERMYWKLLERVANHLERIEASSPGDVFTRGARQSPQAAAEATARGLDSNPRLAEKVNRTLRPGTW